MSEVSERTGSARRRAALLAAALAVATSAAGAQSPAPDDTRTRLDQSRRTLEETRQREQGLERDVELLEAERARINRNLIDTAKAIQRGESKLTEIEARLGELESQQRIVQGSLSQNHANVAKLLSAMQRMGRNPPPVLVTRREDALEMVRSAMLLASVFPELKEQALQLADKLNELTRVTTALRKEGEQLKTETQRLSDARARLDRHLTEKRENILERQGELKAVRQAAADLSQSVSDLNELISRMDQTVAEKAGVAEYERELRSTTTAEAKPASPPPTAITPEPAAPASRQAALPEKGQPPAATGAPTAAAPAPAQEIKPKAGERTALVNPGRLKPSQPFERLKGSLPLPAAGRRVIAFGDRTEVGVTSKGVVIETRADAQITSPSDGWVVYAGPFRSYGQLLIINAGGGYHIVLAGMTKITAVMGQFVLAGEPVGTMGQPGAAGAQAKSRAAGKAPEALPVLYIEFRKDGRSIDPDPWWVPEGAQRAQG